MSAYLAWNDALAKYFFGTGKAGEEVYLHVTRDLLKQLGQELGAAESDFVNAVMEGPAWASSSSLCHRAYEAMKDWRKRGLQWPPYIAYLGLFVLAWMVEGEFAPHAYYPRLWKLVGIGDTRMPPGFEKMWELWEDLETWAVHDCKGKLGIFKARSIGGHIHIGYPLAQAILPPEDLHRLPAIFASAQLDPVFSRREELLRALLSYKSHLSARTRRVLSGKLGEGALEYMIELVEEKLREWDGEAPGDPGVATTGSKQVHGWLRLCLLDLDLVAGTACSVLRCQLKAELPESGVYLILPGNQVAMATWEGNGWSAPLETEDGKYLDASTLDWEAGLELKESSYGWIFRLPPGQARVFARADLLGLPGLVESPSIPPGGAVIAARRPLCEELAFHAAAACTLVQGPLEIKGIPPGWSVVVIGTIEDPSRLPSWLGSFRTEGLRARLAGGIRAGRGEVFFAFAPPRVQVEGDVAGVRVYANGQLALSLGDSGLHEIPASVLQPGSRVTIEVHRGEDVVWRRTIFLVESFEWRTRGPAGLLERYSAPEVDKRSAASRWQELALEDIAGSRPLFLVGRAPGQVARWSPRTPFPSWEPVWVVSGGRKPGVFFCGLDPGTASPLPEPAGCRQHMREWKKLVWYWRKRVAVPPERFLQALWRQYGKVARDTNTRRPAPVCAVCGR